MRVFSSYLTCREIQTVTIQLGDTTLRIIDQHGELITTVPRAANGQISRFKAYGTRTRQPR
jgi:hypothetical protein